MKGIFKKIIQGYIAALLKIFITVALFIIYIFGFGLTFIFALIFNRKLLRFGYKTNDTFWIQARDYEADISESTRQS